MHFLETRGRVNALRTGPAPTRRTPGLFGLRKMRLPDKYRLCWPCKCKTYTYTYTSFFLTLFTRCSQQRTRALLQTLLRAGPSVSHPISRASWVAGRLRGELVRLVAHWLAARMLTAVAAVTAWSTHEVGHQYSFLVVAFLSRAS